MNNSHISQERSAKEEFNSEPVFYCKQCLSLKIRGIPGMEGMDYCDDCNSTNIEQTSIEEWEKLYEQKYGYKFLDKTF